MWCFKYSFLSLSRLVPLAQAADGLAAKSPAKAGKASSYSKYCPCPATLLQFWMKMAIPPSATATMRGARRCGVLVSWRRRWARCSRSATAGMCLTRKRGCTICGVGTIIRSGGGLLMRIIQSFLMLRENQISSHIALIVLFYVSIRQVMLICPNFRKERQNMNWLYC